MPICHRCNRTSASADVRRTTKGHVCKDSVQCKRNLSLTVTPILDVEKVEQLIGQATLLRERATTHDPIMILRTLNNIADVGGEIALATCETAARETKLTNKALAEAIGVPASALRGLRAS